MLYVIELLSASSWETSNTHLLVFTNWGDLCTGTLFIATNFFLKKLGFKVSIDLLSRFVACIGSKNNNEKSNKLVKMMVELSLV